VVVKSYGLSGHWLTTGGLVLSDIGSLYFGSGLLGTPCAEGLLLLS
jgi:hypothetical protein